MVQHRLVSFFSLIYSITYLYRYGVIDIYFLCFGLKSNATFVVLFLLKLSNFDHWKLFQLVPVALDTSHHCVVCVFLRPYSVTARCSRLILYISCPSPRITYFSQELWDLSLENNITNKIWALGVLNATGAPLPIF